MVRISNFQALVMIYSTVVANGALYLPRLGAGLGGPGGWIPVLLMGIASILALMALVRVCSHFPDASFVNLNKRVFGRFIGTLVGVIIVIHFTFEAGNVARGVVNIAIITVFSQTPMVVLIGILMAVAVYAIYQGIEVLARTNTVLFVLKAVALIAIIFLPIPAMEIKENLLPLWDRGSLPWAEGLLNIQTAYSGFIILAFLYPNINNHQDTMKMASMALMLVTFAYVTVTVITLGVFNYHVVNRLIWPSISLIRSAPVPVDAPFMMVWLSGAFSVLAGCLYIASDALKDVLKLKDYRSILLPLAVIAVVIGLLPKNMMEFGQFGTNIGYSGIVLQLVLPFILLAVITITRKNKPEQ